MERSAGRDRGRLGHLVPKSQGADLPNHGQGPQAVGTQSLQLSGNAGRHHPGDEGRAAMKWKDLQGEIAADWGISSRNRKVRIYRITAKGRKQLERKVSSFQEMLEGITRAMKA